MDTLDKIIFLTDKKVGIGIPMVVIGRYLGCHPSTITYYLEGKKEMKEHVREQYEEGIARLIKDFNKIME